MKDYIVEEIHQIDELEQEFNLLLSDEEMALERRALAEFAVGANLAHNLAYQANSKLGIIGIKEEDKINRDYQVIKINSGHAAIQVEMYLPVNSNDKSNVYINFRGTCDLPTLHADFEGNAGEQAFHRNKKHIMAQIADAVRQVEARTHQPVTLHFAGHSLGGALAQHGTNETLRYLAQNLKEKTLDESLTVQITDANAILTQAIEKNNTRVDNSFSKEVLSQLQKVGAVKLSTWSSTGVSKEVQNHSNQMADLLINHHYAIAARFGMIGGDFVQQTGEGTVLSDCDADVRVLKLDLGYEGFQSNLLKAFLVGGGCVAAGLVLGPVVAGAAGTVGFLTRAALPTLRAHLSPYYCFNEESKLQRHGSSQEDIGYEMLHNQNPEARAAINKRLQHKSSLLQAAPLKIAKNALHNVAKGCSRVGLPRLGRTLGAAVDSATSMASDAFKKINPFSAKVRI